MKRWMLCLLVLAACGEPVEPPKKGPSGGASAAEPEPEAAGAAAYVRNPAQEGAVAGKTVFKGMPPKRRAQNVECETHKHIDVTSETVIVNEDGTLRNVFVYVKQGLGALKFDAPKTAVVLDQKNCRYEPHVFGIMVGQPLTIRNSDGTLHNVHSMAEKNPSINIGQTAGTENTEMLKFGEVMVKFKCDVHGWMSAYAGVLKHPYFAVTDDGGAFELAGLPAGDYVVAAWHEELGTQTQNVTVKAGERPTLEFTFEKK